MPTFFSIVRYVPDPIAEERVNIGVLVFGEGRPKMRFLSRWDRVHRFAGSDVSFLQDVISDLEVFVAGQTSLWDQFVARDFSALQELYGKWRHTVQLSEPRASLKSPSELLAEVETIYLKAPAQRKRETRDKRYVVARGFRAIEIALRRQIGAQTESVLRREVPIPGKFEEHVFDIAVADSRMLLAATGLSFQVAESEALRKDVDVAAWAIDDVRKVNKGLPIGIIALPPRSEGHARTSFQRAMTIFSGLRAQMVMEEAVGGWVDQISKRAGIRALRLVGR
jgi:hypothetical protein